MTIYCPLLLLITLPHSYRRKAPDDQSGLYKLQEKCKVKFIKLLYFCCVNC